MSNELSPKVSVCVLTYNHEKYIAECIESLVSQAASFDIEIIIGDDFSTDKTLEIIQAYQKKYSQVIRVLNSECNVGMNHNLVRLLSAARGEYIALCEGDDFWTHNHKLELQVKFLDMNKQYDLIFTNRTVLEGGRLSEVQYIHKDYNMTDVLEGFIPPTQTLLWRTEKSLPELISKYPNNKSGDRLIAYFFAQKGLIGHINVTTATYRITGEGVWSSVLDTNRRRLKFQHLCNFHKMLNIDDKVSLKICAEELMLDSLHTVKKFRPGIFSNLKDALYFTEVIGVVPALRAVLRKIFLR